MKNLILKNLKIILANKSIKGHIIVNNGIIENIIEDENYKFVKNTYDEIFYKIIDLNWKTVIPGFIDIHIHGIFGGDTMDNSVSSLITMSKFLATTGVTNFLPTTLSAPKENLLKILKTVSSVQNKNIDGANIFGIHMEGPHFDVEFKGAQDERFLTLATTDVIKEYLNVQPNLIKLFSLSASHDSDMKVIKYLSDNGVVVSVGHSNGTYEILEKAIDSGLTHGTHTFNGMKGFNHREIGIAGGILLRDEINAELIFDKIHVHPKAAELLIKIKGVDKVLLISDSMIATGLEDGEYKLGQLDVYVKNGQARLKSNDALAGSVLTMNVAFKNIIEQGYSIYDAVKMTSTNQAKEFNLNAGKIEIGYQADLTILNENFDIFMTIVNGEIKYCKE